MLEYIPRNLFCQGLTVWLNDYVLSGTFCQQMKDPRNAHLGLLHAFQVLFVARAATLVDFMTGVLK